MRWAAAGLGIVVLIVVGIGAWLFLPPPTSGDGWRTDPEASWHEPLLPGGESRVIAYAASDEEIGIGVTAFGSSSCPPTLQDVRIGAEAIEVAVSGEADPLAGACTADLSPHQIGILVRRDALPSLPFTVIVRHAEAVDETEITGLP
jgi:hypothetical protein